MEFSKFAEAIGKETGLEAEKILASHGCTIRYHNEFDVHIEWDEISNIFCFYAPLFRAPETGNGKFYQYLLNTHVFGAATQGATFGYHHKNHEIMLFRSGGAKHFTEASVLEDLEAFVRQVAFWRKHLPTT